MKCKMQQSLTMTPRWTLLRKWGGIWDSTEPGDCRLCCSGVPLLAFCRAFIPVTSGREAMKNRTTYHHHQCAEKTEGHGQIGVVCTMVLSTPSFIVEEGGKEDTSFWDISWAGICPRLENKVLWEQSSHRRIVYESILYADYSVLRTIALILKQLRDSLFWNHFHGLGTQI